MGRFGEKMEQSDQDEIEFALTGPIKEVGKKLTDAFKDDEKEADKPEGDEPDAEVAE